MSVIVKGMEFPENCLKCDLRGYDANAGEEYCPFTQVECLSIGRQEACPLVELPEKHGDLIDRQKLLEDNKHLEYPTDGKYRRDRAWAVGFNAGAKHCNEHAVYAKTIIEAEGVEE